ncbi:hypothetical protein [Streptomyces sp. NPDC097610]|uniref:hypothetical protein n=1 Tax=Streptomyces sp. NPDC097610 TaxID=3157227 RepID=UPI0033175E89
MDDLTRRAADTIAEALDDGRDVAEFLAHALCTVAADEDGTEEVLRNRSGPGISAPQALPGALGGLCGLGGRMGRGGVQSCRCQLSGDMLITQARRSVVGRTLDEVEEAREGARRVYRLVSKVVLDDEDQRRLEAAVVKLDTLDEVLEEMRTTGAARYERREGAAAEDSGTAQPG